MDNTADELVWAETEGLHWIDMTDTVIMATLEIDEITYSWDDGDFWVEYKMLDICDSYDRGNGPILSFFPVRNYIGEMTLVEAKQWVANYHEKVVEKLEPNFELRDQQIAAWHTKFDKPKVKPEKVSRGFFDWF